MMRWIFVCLVLALASTSAVAHYTKKSRSDTCHTDASPYFNRISNYEKYYTMAECVADGGKPSRWDREAIVSDAPEYDRAEFGHGWQDEDRDGQNTRTEVLIDQSTIEVTFATEDEERVIRGRWLSPFTGNVLWDASNVDIDHIVPLKWAWEHGAYIWSYDLRVTFANDPINLISVESSLNRSKGAKGPNDWLPPTNECEYIIRFKRIMLTYDLQYTAAERTEVEELSNVYECRS